MEEDQLDSNSLQSFIAVQPWAIFVTSLSLSVFYKPVLLMYDLHTILIFLKCIVRIIPTFEGCWEDFKKYTTASAKY